MYMNSAQNHLFIFMPCTNGRRLSVVRISAFSDFEATYAKQGYRYRVGCSYVQYLSVSFARVPSLNLFDPFLANVLPLLFHEPTSIYSIQDRF